MEKVKIINFQNFKEDFNKFNGFNELIVDNVFEHLNKEESLFLLEKISQLSFVSISFETYLNNFNKFDGFCNLKIYPFNLFNFEKEVDVTPDKKLLTFKYDDYIYNMKYLRNLYIKDYDGSSAKKYIMYQFHEEFTGYLGDFDINFKYVNNMNDYFINKYGTYPKSLLLLWNFSEEIYIKIRKELPNTKIILWLDDLHWFEEKIYQINKSSYEKSDIIISHYNHINLFYQINTNNKLWRTYHSCSINFYKNEINLIPKKLIFFYGAQYPLRTWFIKSMEDLFKDKIVIKSHPGYVGDQFETAKELYEYEICYTSGLFPKFSISEPKDAIYYLTGKFFEICGSGVLLLCNDYGVRKELNNLGFYNMEHYIHIDENNFSEIIKWLFDSSNSCKIFEIRKRGHELIAKHHMVKNRSDQINKKMIII